MRLPRNKRLSKISRVESETWRDFSNSNRGRWTPWLRRCSFQLMLIFLEWKSRKKLSRNIELILKLRSTKMSACKTNTTRQKDSWTSWKLSLINSSLKMKRKSMTSNLSSRQSIRSSCLRTKLCKQRLMTKETKTSLSSSEETLMSRREESMTMHRKPTNLEGKETLSKCRKMTILFKTREKWSTLKTKIERCNQKLID